MTLNLERFATLLRPLLLLLLLTSVLNAHGVTASSSNSSSDDGDCSDLTSFDYVVVGGGTCGLVIAARLSEDPNVTVAIIEAGASVLHDPNVTNTTRFGLALDTDIDWQYQSAPQQYTFDRVQTYHAGKALGGTSTLNGMTYVRAENSQIDALQRIGNTNWSWADLLQYYKRAERFEVPSEQARTRGAMYEPQYHGESGPVNVSFNPILPVLSEYKTIQSVWESLGFSTNQDTSSGSIQGFSVWPMTLDAVSAIRSDAARAYYWPIQQLRSNLVAFVNTTATKINWDTGEGQLRAASVEATTASGEQLTISAENEIILSAGSLRSPVLLEQSGVGNPKILSQFGVEVVLDLPGVGENLQDQPNSPVVEAVNANYSGYPTYVTYATAKDLFGNNLTAVETLVRQSIPEYATTIAMNSHNSTTQAIQETLLGIQADLIFKQQIPVAEILTAASGAVIDFAHWGLLPFSRGSVHMTSTTGVPAINPNFFMLDWDAILQIATAKLARKAGAKAALLTKGGNETSPGFSLVPGNATDEQWLNYLKQSYGPNYHPVGTVAMMSKELGGVVDQELKVYGTDNLRVIDASVLPYQMDGHLSSTLYAFAEKTVEMIKSARLV